MRYIFADDLTGACDVAAALGRPSWVAAAPDTPIGVETEFAVINCETRILAPEEARRQVRRLLGHLDGPIAYWKMDSLLRGNWAHEVAEAIDAGAVRRVLAAPAFPGQGRTTRAGVQHAHGVPLEDIAARLRAAGVPPEAFRVADAESEDDLRAAAAGLQPEETPAGSAGLARALWGPVAADPVPVAGRVLVVVGTASARGREQMAALRGFERLQVVAPGPLPELLPRVEAALAQVLPDALVVVGGHTLSGVAQLLEIRGFLVRGEFAPGVALAIIQGGPLDGRQIVTKAGEFGERGTLAAAACALLRSS